MVTRQIAEDVNQVLANLHTLDVLHRDLEELNAYPDVGFRNIFLRSDPITGQKSICILDFDRAEVTSDKTKLAKESNRVAEMLERSMSHKPAKEYLSKEARKLL
ncbi:hypothetical protein BLS_003971 [Venturia inaequalis]|nr:hypothetical protein BLS_003971 [Venturia inaequalis]RDI86732.1 hypothetical protein Vi05172_g3239 [Venturia inaequalis]